MKKLFIALLLFAALPALASSSATRKNYPNGDVYFLTGDLHDKEGSDWVASDFARFYTNAKWFSQRGFRVIINPYATINDAREAVLNPDTSIIIWNSHGDEGGGVRDATGKKLPVNTFRSGASKRLKYILFATCYGKDQAEFYKIRHPIKWYGWADKITSDEFFEYFNGENSALVLEEALGKKLPVLR